MGRRSPWSRSSAGSPATPCGSCTGISRSRRSTHTPCPRPRPPKRRGLRASSGRCTRLCSNTRTALDDAHLIAYAATVGLDARTVAEALDDQAYAERVREDVVGGLESGVTGTPTFFINGVRYEDAYDFDSLMAALGTAAEVSQR